MKPLYYSLNIPNDRTVFVKDESLDIFYPHFHQHNEYQLVWIVEGEGKLVVDNSFHYFEKDDIFLIGSNQPHVFKSEALLTTVRTISVFFDMSGTLEYIFGLPELRGLYTFITTNNNGFRVPRDYVNEVISKILVLQQSESVDRLINFFYLLKILNNISKDIAPLSGAIIKELNDINSIRIVSICKYIQNNFRKEIKLDDMAEKASLTSQAFCRYFKKSTGKTFISYLNALRVSEACRLLVNERYDCISMIAYNAGFNSITNFNRVFRLEKGLSPKEYLQQYQKSLI